MHYSQVENKLQILGLAMLVHILLTVFSRNVDVCIPTELQTHLKALRIKSIGSPQCLYALLIIPNFKLSITQIDVRLLVHITQLQCFLIEADCQLVLPISVEPVGSIEIDLSNHILHNVWKIFVDLEFFMIVLFLQLKQPLVIDCRIVVIVHRYTSFKV